MVIVMDFETIAKVVASVSYEVYLQILPEFIQYRFDCSMRAVEEYVDEYFSQRNNNKNGDSRENK